MALRTLYLDVLMKKEQKKDVTGVKLSTYYKN
jgi:hypothetical protein